MRRLFIAMFVLGALTAQAQGFIDLKARLAQNN